MQYFSIPQIKAESLHLIHRGWEDDFAVVDDIFFSHPQIH